MQHITGVKLYHDHYPTEQYYPFNLSVLRETSRLTFRKPMVFFVGENGSGKSTLLEAITRKCGVHIWHRAKRHVAHHNPYETRLVDFIDIDWADDEDRAPGSLFRAETFREFADFLDDVALCDPGRLKYQGGELLNTLSHGEAMLSYFSGRYDVRGVYFLDEPEAALSPASQVKFLQVLQEVVAKGQAQFIIATHSPILLAYPDAQIFSFDDTEIKEVAYEETNHYQIYRDFLSHRDAYLSN
jgi:predicted ATPase